MTSEQIIESVNKEFEILQNPFELTETLRFLLARKPHNIMEIGAYRGGSFACWHKVASGKCIYIDHPTKTPADFHRERAEKLQQYPNIYPIIADSHLPETVDKVREVLNGELLDFLLVDGDHTYEASKQDYDLYKSLVNPNKGVIGFHDINESDQTRAYGADVHKFWNELKGNKITITAGLEWCGMGLLVLDPSPAITWMTQRS